MICPDCSKDNIPGADTCERCGQSLTPLDKPGHQTVIDVDGNGTDETVFQPVSGPISTDLNLDRLNDRVNGGNNLNDGQWVRIARNNGRDQNPNNTLDDQHPMVDFSFGRSVGCRLTLHDEITGAGFLKSEV